MAVALLTLPLRTKRDIMAARQRARQIAGLLGFDPPARLAIGAQTFEIACAARRRRRGQAITFQITEQVLQIFAGGAANENVADVREQAKRVVRPATAELNPRGVARLVNRLCRSSPETASLRLETPLPQPILSVEDTAWAVGELARQTPLDLFEEIQQQNREMLKLLPELLRAAPRAEVLNRPSAA